MLVQDVVDTARYSELNAVSVKDNTAAIIAFLNLGMLELYKRFPISIKEHLVNLVDGQLFYDLPTDCMYTLSVYGEVAETGLGDVEELPVNDVDEPLSVFFPNHKQVQVPAATEGSYISIIYVAKPTIYTVDDLDSELDLPETLIEPLLHYIGYKAHLGVRSDAQSENNAHYIRFDRSCHKARELGVAFPADSWRMIDRLSSRGFA